MSRFYFQAKDLKESIRLTATVARWLIVFTASIALVLQSIVLLVFPAGHLGMHGRWEVSCILWAAAGSGIGQIPAQYLRNAQRPFAVSALQLNEFAMNVGAGLLFVLGLNRGLRGAIEASAAAAVANGMISIVFVSIALKAPLSRLTLRDALKFSLPYMPHALGNQLHAIADRWIMKVTGNDAALGVYALASQLSTPVSMSTQAWNTASNPQLGEASRHHGAAGLAEQAHRYQRSHVLVTTAASVAVCIGLPVASLLIGKDFAGALHVIPVICAILVFEGISFANADLIFYLNEPGTLPKITVTAGIFNIGLNVVLIPLFGMWGAVLARGLSMSFRAGTMWYVARLFLRRSVPGPAAEVG